jgi:hypothetical protein
MDTTETNSTTTPVEAADLSLDIESIAIDRLIEEVRSGDPASPATDYNRTYNRHNR